MANDTPLSTRKLDRLAGGGLTLAAFCLYAFTLAPTVLEADSGEFQFTAWLPGITHPTGYPLYTLLGWLWTHVLPIGEVAWRMNLLSAVLAAVTVGLTYAVARQLLNLTLPDTPLPGRMLAALIAAGTFAVTPTFWSQAIIAEVYTLHTLLVVAILGLALKLKSAEFSPSSPAGKWLAFTIGLSLTHHRTIVLLLPALGVYLGLIWRDSSPSLKAGGSILKKQGTLRLLLTCFSLLAAPLLLYLYLPLIAPTTPYATLFLSKTQTLVLYDNSLSGFWNHLMGTVFTGALKPAAVGVDRLRLTWQFLQQQVGSLGVIFALTGLVTLWQRRRFDLLLLTGLASLTLVAFNLVYFIGDVEVLFIPVWLLVCLWLGLGCLGLAHWLAQSFVRRKTGPTQNRIAFGSMEQRLSQQIYHMLLVILVGICFLGVIPPVIQNFKVNQSHNTAARDRWQEILAEPLPTGTVLVSNDRNEIMPLWYYQYVDGRRPDLSGLFPLIVTDPAYANVGRVLDQALISGRPVYLIKPMAGLTLKANLTPAGSLYRAIVYNAPPAHQREIIFKGPTDTLKLLGYDLSADSVLPGETITMTIHWQAIKPLVVDYTSYVHLVNPAGQDVTQSDHMPGGDFYASSYWQPGEILRDRHTLILPLNAPSGLYRLRVGLYYQPKPGLIENRLGSGVEIGQVRIASK